MCRIFFGVYDNLKVNEYMEFFLLPAMESTGLRAGPGI